MLDVTNLNLEILCQKFSLTGFNSEKKPVGNWKKSQEVRNSAQEVNYLASQPQATSLAIVTGKISEIIVIDCDVADGGMESLEKMGLKPHVITPSGGAHIWAKHPGYKIKTASRVSKDLPGVDIRGDGGCAIFYGSSHKGEYIFPNGIPEPYEFEEIPKWVRQSLGLEKVEEKKGVPNQTFSGKIGNANRKLLKRAISKGRPGCRNDVGFILACSMRDNGTDEDDAWDVMQEYVKAVGHLGNHEYDDKEAGASLSSAYSREAPPPIR